MDILLVANHCSCVVQQGTHYPTKCHPLPLSKTLLISFVYLALRLKRTWILPSDLVRWIDNGLIPFTNLYGILPDSVKKGYITETASFFYSKSYTSTLSHLQLSYQSLSLAKSLCIYVPPLNAPLVAKAFIDQLGLPEKVWHYYGKIAQIMMTPEKGRPIEGADPFGEHYPEYIMAVIIIACKCCKGWSRWGLEKASHTDENNSSSKETEIFVMPVNIAESKRVPRSQLPLLLETADKLIPKPRYSSLLKVNKGIMEVLATFNFPYKSAQPQSDTSQSQSFSPSPSLHSRIHWDRLTTFNTTLKPRNIAVHHNILIDDFLTYNEKNVIKGLDGMYAPIFKTNIKRSELRNYCPYVSYGRKTKGAVPGLHHMQYLLLVERFARHLHCSPGLLHTLVEKLDEQIFTSEGNWTTLPNDKNGPQKSLVRESKINRITPMERKYKGYKEYCDSRLLDLRKKGRKKSPLTRRSIQNHMLLRKDFADHNEFLDFISNDDNRMKHQPYNRKANVDDQTVAQDDPEESYKMEGEWNAYEDDSNSESSNVETGGSENEALDSVKDGQPSVGMEEAPSLMEDESEGQLHDNDDNGEVNDDNDNFPYERLASLSMEYDLNMSNEDALEGDDDTVEEEADTLTMEEWERLQTTNIGDVCFVFLQRNSKREETESILLNRAEMYSSSAILNEEEEEEEEGLALALSKIEEALDAESVAGEYASSVFDAMDSNYSGNDSALATIRPQEAVRDCLDAAEDLREGGNDQTQSAVDEAGENSAHDGTLEDEEVDCDDRSIVNRSRNRQQAASVKAKKKYTRRKATEVVEGPSDDSQSLGSSSAPPIKTKRVYTRRKKDIGQTDTLPGNTQLVEDRSAVSPDLPVKDKARKKKKVIAEENEKVSALGSRSDRHLPTTAQRLLKRRKTTVSAPPRAKNRTDEGRKSDSVIPIGRRSGAATRQRSILETHSNNEENSVGNSSSLNDLYNAATALTYMISAPQVRASSITSEEHGHGRKVRRRKTVTVAAQKSRMAVTPLRESSEREATTFRHRRGSAERAIVTTSATEDRVIEAAALSNSINSQLRDLFSAVATARASAKSSGEENTS